MKIGLLVCAYNQPDTIQDALRPWLALQASGRLDIEIGIVSTQFQGFPAKDNRKTLEKIQEVIYKSKAFVVTYPTPLMEHEARNMPLTYFLHDNTDVVWLLDGDEIYTEEQILAIVARVERSPFIVWWRIPFKNYVFDGKQWVDGFCPPRIFRNQVGDQKLKEFYWDNDLTYESIDGKTQFDYLTLPNSRISESVANIKHLTWLHSNGKDKVSYQKEHFGGCSYHWNESTQQLEFDLDFYLKSGQTPPILHTD